MRTRYPGGHALLTTFYIISLSINQSHISFACYGKGPKTGKHCLLDKTSWMFPLQQLHDQNSWNNILKLSVSSCPRHSAACRLEANTPHLTAFAAFLSLQVTEMLYLRIFISMSKHPQSISQQGHHKSPSRSRKELRATLILENCWYSHMDEYLNLYRVLIKIADSWFFLLQ